MTHTYQAQLPQNGYEKVGIADDKITQKRGSEETGVELTIVQGSDHHGCWPSAQPRYRGLAPVSALGHPGP